MPRNRATQELGPFPRAWTSLDYLLRETSPLSLPISGFWGEMWNAKIRMSEIGGGDSIFMGEAREKWNGNTQLGIKRRLGHALFTIGIWILDAA